MKTVESKELLEKSNIYFNKQIKEICIMGKRQLDSVIEDLIYSQEDVSHYCEPMNIEIHKDVFDQEIQEVFDLFQGIVSQCDDKSNLFENLKNKNQIKIDRISQEYQIVIDIFSRIGKRRSHSY